MSAINNFLILLFALAWSGFLIFMDAQDLPHLAHQFASRNYPSTTGQITHSEATRRAGSKGNMTHDLKISYRYEVGGQTFESACYRYGDKFANQKDLAWANNATTAHPVGAQTQVYFNPKNPSDALLSPGLNGDDLVFLSFSMVFHLVGLLMLVTPMAWLRRIIFNPAVGGVEIQSTGQMIRARLPRFRPILVAILSAIGLTFVVVLFIQNTHPSLAAAETALVTIYGGGIAVYFLCRQKIRSGDYDLIIDAGASTVSLPKTIFGRDRMTLNLTEISAVTVETKRNVGSRGAVSLSYAPTLRLHGKESKTFTLANWGEQSRAEGFAAWLRKQFGFAA